LPAISTLVILQFQGTWNDFFWPLILFGQGTPSHYTVQLGLAEKGSGDLENAQRWFSQALSAEKTGSAGAVNEAVQDQPESFSQVLNLLMATSIGRAPLLELEWNLALTAEKAGRKR